MSFYEDNYKLIKAISDPNRLKILDILSCGEQCACDILKLFDFSQPTLSHHMKYLIDCGLVVGRKEGTWMRYRINLERANQMMYFLMGIFTPKEYCICKECNHPNCNCDIKKEESVNE